MIASGRIALFVTMLAFQSSVGRLVDVGGHDLNVVCRGEGAPTVLLEAGSGDASSVWAAVQQGMTASVTVCAYDRAGSGSSGSGPSPRTMLQEVFELHALLAAADVPTPYVLVGHSYGGLLVRLYTDQHPDDVAGMVLVDPTHENTRLSVQRRGESQPTWVRVREGARGLAIPEPRRVSDGPSAGGNAYFWSDELEQMHQRRLGRPAPLGDRPLIVLAALRPEPLPGASDEFRREMAEEKLAEKADLATLSRNAKLIQDPSSGHRIHQDNPALVVAAIEQVVAAARTGGKLK